MRLVGASYLTVYYKTFTDCSYHEIGLLVMFTSLGSALFKPLVCSYADRRANYKSCLAAAVVINGLSTFALALVPFFPQLLFDEPHPRLMWYLVAINSFIGHICLGVAITLNDVFVIQECLQSSIGEHFGQYRVFGGIGWALSSVSVALVEPRIQLPYLALPLLAASLFLLADLPLVLRMSEIVGRSQSGAVGSNDSRVRCQMRRTSAKPASTLAIARTPMANPPMSRKSPFAQEGTLEASAHVSVEPERLRQPGRAAYASSSWSASLGLDDKGYFAQQTPQLNNGPALDQLGDRGSDARISFMTQLDLLVHLSRFDRHHLVKYLIQFVLLGAFIQIHYIFYFQYLTEILGARELTFLVFTLSALIQVSDFAGQTVSLLWIARFLIDNLGRDVSFLLALLISGLRAAIIGFLVDQLSVWTLAILEVQTGLLYGISYTLMIESASSYLSILDGLLLLETDTEDSNGDKREAAFRAKLEQLKESSSIEAIRFAIRATVQGIFSGACEGVGFAMGPLLAGVWLSMRQDSLATLYRDMAVTHLAVLLAIVALEFALMRLLVGSRSKIDRLIIGGTGQLAPQSLA